MPYNSLTIRTIDLDIFVVKKQKTLTLILVAI